MFKNFTIESILIVTSICVMLTTTINIYVSYKQTESIENLVIEQNNEVLPHAISFLNLKISVIQVQQWLTDISATRGMEGFDDGFKEGRIVMKRVANGWYSEYIHGSTSNTALNEVKSK